MTQPTDAKHDFGTAQPQNPYASYLVAASAGSGKTYQLSQRFLYLVGAGAAPSSILTVTFTKKAAGEMRARILEEAACLAADSRKQESFTKQLGRFYAAQGSGTHKPPVAATEVARKVLASSQLLKISTIDSLFLEWVSKFPLESSAALADPAGAPLPSPFQLISPMDARGLHRRAWRGTCEILSRAAKQGDERFAPMLRSLVRDGLSDLEQRLIGLDRQDTYLWYREMQADDGVAFLPHRHHLQDEGEVVGQIATAFAAVAAVLADRGRAAAVTAALAARDFASLLATGLLTKQEFTISGTYIRGKKREQLTQEISHIEACVQAHVSAERLHQLSQEGQSHYQLYGIYRLLRDQLKFQAGEVEFRDLVKGSYRLLHGAGSAGVRFLLSRTVHHVMLDEFQDTSRLQWGVFHELITQMLAGEGSDEASGLSPTVFIVGDAKQSIYGFREADAAVLGEAQSSLAERLALAPLNDSYRTAQVVLDYVNQVFHQGLGAQFPRHQTASHGGAAFVPDVGRVLIAPLIAAVNVDADTPSREDFDEAPSAEGQDDDEDPATGAGAEREATEVAQLIAAMVRGDQNFPVYDKEARGFRPLRAQDCCILYRSTTKAALFAAALRREGIACQREEERGFFSRPEITDACALLRFLALPGDTVALATVLRSPLGGVADTELLQVLAATQREAERTGKILELIEQVQPQLGKTLQSLLTATDQLLPHALLLEALDRFDAFAAFARVAPEGAEAEATLVRRNLLRLVELVIRLEGDGLTSLAPLIERLGLLAGDDELGNAAAPADAVTLMTIHKAKGLEFPCVFLVDTARPWGKQDLYWTQGSSDSGRAGLYYIGKKAAHPPSDRDFEGLLAASAAAVTSECQRLLYVALTRSRQYLVVSGHQVGGRQGLATTQMYHQLAEAVSAMPGLVHYTLGGVSLSGVSSVPDSGLSGEAVSAAATPIPALTWHPTSGLPREIVIASPSRHGGTLGTGRPVLALDQSLGTSLAAAVGTFLHLGLEAFMSGKAFSPDAAWQAQLAPLHPPPELQAQVFAEWAELRDDPALNALREAARGIETELPLVHLDGDQMIVGTLDLLLEDNAGNLLIVDYKTTRFALPATQIPDAALTIFSRQRGYQDQLADYTRAVRALYPGTTVTAAVYFTSLRRLVRLISTGDTVTSR
ncbi:MAG: UvrD-helicase domain-containing protein [Proteobacteria bacterium]|nr:UvrD-helicase domain-containing protein [Pseudomonadota bacterium]